MRVRIESATEHLQACPSLDRFCLEWPRAGVATNAFSLRFTGWFISRTFPILAVSIDCRGQPLDTLRPIPRPDVVKAYPGSAASLIGGFEGVVATVGISGRACLTVMVHFATGAECPATVIIVIEPAAVAYQPARHPILLTSTGRAGSTLGMALLSAHPDIVTDGPFPYEHKCALYWLHAALMLGSTSDRARSTIGAEFEGNRFSLGMNPYLNVLPEALPHSTRWANEALPGLMIQHFVAVIDSYYQQVAIDVGKPYAPYFIEKAFDRHLPPVVRELYPLSKEVFVVRDPRDMYVSICAYHRKWGYKMYADRDGFVTEHEHIEYLGNRMRQLLDDWQAREATSCLLRYEDLVRNPEASTECVFKYLGVECEPEVVEAAVARAFAVSDEVKGHATSRGALDSVSRWRRELAEPVAAFCNVTFRPVLESLGYELA